MKRKSLKLNNVCSRNWPVNTTWFSSQKPPEVTWFMESPLSPVRMHWDHEPESGPLTPSLSPSEGGEGAQPICTLPFAASET